MYGVTGTSRTSAKRKRRRRARSTERRRLAEANRQCPLCWKPYGAVCEDAGEYAGCTGVAQDG